MTTPRPGRRRENAEPAPEIAVEGMRTRTRRVVQDNLASAAMQLFLSRGYDAVSVDDIAAAAGISQRSFFRYFATKDEILRRYWRSLSTALVTAFCEQPESLDAVAALRAALLATSQVAPAHRDRVHAIGRLLLETPEMWARIVGDSLLEPGIAAELARRTGAEPGSVAPSAQAAAIVGAANAGWTAWLHAASDTDPATFIAEAVDLIMLGGLQFTTDTR